MLYISYFKNQVNYLIAMVQILLSFVFDSLKRIFLKDKAPLPFQGLL